MVFVLAVLLQGLELLFGFQELLLLFVELVFELLDFR